MLNSGNLIRFDWAMKSILRDKANFDILEGFLSSLLNDDIMIEEILEGESNQDEENAKFNRVDILVKGCDGTRFIIEIQNETEADYLERLLFGTCKIIVENLSLGNRYKEIKKVISVSIMYFNLGSGTDYLYHGKTEFIGVHTGEKLKVKTIVELRDDNNKTVRKFVSKKNLYPEYYLIEVERFGDVIKEDIDEWVYFFKNVEIKEEFHSKNIQKICEKLRVLKMSEGQRKLYERYLMNLASERDIIETAKDDGVNVGIIIGMEKGIEKGKKVGIEEGKKVGIEEGKKVGIEEGKKVGIEEGKKVGIEEGRKAGAYDVVLKTAKIMKDKGFSHDQIIEVTSLKSEDIEKL